MCIMDWSSDVCSSDLAMKPSSPASASNRRMHSTGGVRRVGRATILSSIGSWAHYRTGREDNLFPLHAYRAGLGIYFSHIRVYEVRMTGLDPFEVKILRELQRAAGLTTAEIAERVGLCQSRCWRRSRIGRGAGRARRCMTV